MKISLWIPAMLLCYVVRIVSPSCIQVGTVLFTTTDLVKKCWSESDKALLTARLVMQDVLPDPDCIDFSKPDAVITLLEYFQSCYKIISVSTYGKLQNLMLLALSDAIGGYLRAYVLPLTRRAFYAGTVDYCEAKKLFQLYDDIKVFLKTNGVGWAKPKKICGVQFKPKPLVLSKEGEAAACSELYTIEKNSITNPSSGSQGCSQEQPQTTAKLEYQDLLEKVRVANSETENSSELKKPEENIDNRQATIDSSKMESKVIQRKRKRKRRNYRSGTKRKIAKTKKEIVSENNNEDINKVQKLKENLVVSPKFQNYSALEMQDKRKFTRDCENIGEKMSSKIVIPLPTLDDPRVPYTIAVPFKVKPLRKVKNEMSAFVLEHYYSSVIKCMLSRESSKTSIKNFNAAFNTWLESQILPLLENEDWYPAFGGVLRVVETIKKLGCRKSFKEKDFKDIGFMFPEGVEIDNPRKGSGRDQVRDVENISLEETPTRSGRYYILYGFFTLGLVGFFTICTLCVCCCTTRKSKPSSVPSSTSSKGRKTKTLDFQFLVQFFKKPDARKYTPPPRRDTGYGNPFYQSKTETTGADYDYYESSPKFISRVGVENKPGENVFAEASKKKSDLENKNFKDKGGGDVPSLTPLNFESQKKYIKSILSPFWPYHSSYAPYQKVGKEKSYPQEEQLQQNLSASKSASKSADKTEVETIWKKPNKRLKKSLDTKDKSKNKLRGIPLPKPKNEVLNVTESETISAEAGESRRRCSSCGYSETPNSQLISTNTSSQTQEALKFNSSALKFSEPAIVKRKTKTGNRSAEYSTEESSSEGEASYSTESNSSESTTLN